MAGFMSSISWFDGIVHIRVFLYDGTKIIERGYDGEGWYTGVYWLENTVGVTSWLDHEGQIHIRAYVGNGADGPIKEYCWDKDTWYEGEFALQTGATGQDASATAWLEKDQFHVRVYVRNSAGQLTEYCWDKDKWYKAHFVQ